MKLFTARAVGMSGIDVIQAPQNYTHIQRSPHMFYRNKVINQFHNQLSIVVLVTSSLTTYMSQAHEYARGRSSSHRK